MIEIVSYDHVAGVRFGDAESAVITRFGMPKRISTTRTGRRELDYENFIVRMSEHSGVFCEFTLLPLCEATLNGHLITWDIEFVRYMARQGGDLKENVGFLVSENLGVSAVGLHEEDDIAIHVFARGEWDFVLNSMNPFSLPQ